MGEYRCRACAWAHVPAVAANCTRCGAPVQRGDGLRDTVMDNRLGETLAAAFKRRGGASDTSLRDLPRPVAWTAFGNNAALLCADDMKVALARIEVPTDPAGEIGITRLKLTNFGPKSLPTLIAPPIASRTSICLVTTSAIHVFRYADGHLPEAIGRKPRPAQADLLICAATLSPRGDLYYATVERSGGVAVRDQDGVEQIHFPTVTVPTGESVGLAVREAEADGDGPVRLRFHIWRDGVVITGVKRDDARPVWRETALPGLRAPALRWDDRIRQNGEAAGEPASWFGWHEARTGVYPLELGSVERPQSGALLLDRDEPRIVPYGLTHCRAMVHSAPDLLLLIDRTSMRLLDPITGRFHAQRGDPSSGVISLVSNGGGVSLSADPDRGEAILEGWSERLGQIERQFRAVLADRAGSEGQHVLLHAVDQMPPIETDLGLLIGLEQGAGATAHPRLWHEVRTFQTTQAVP